MKTTYTKILSVLMLLFVAAMVVSCGENDILEPSVTNKIMRRSLNWTQSHRASNMNIPTTMAWWSLMTNILHGSTRRMWHV